MTLDSGGEPHSPFDPTDPENEAAPPAAIRRIPLAGRIVALIEVLLCSDYPTQAALSATFAAFGFAPFGPDGQLRSGFVATLSLVDTAILLGLICFFLLAHGERPRDVFLGFRPVPQEISLGLPLVLVAIGLAMSIILAIQQFAPALHNVAHNPLQDLIRRPGEIWLFTAVVVIAGGVREELQRAFLLHRFEHWLGGATVGLVVANLAFGAGHLLQGVDAAIATATLGLFWGIVYLRRRSAVAPIVSHSGFNLLQIVQFLTIGR